MGAFDNESSETESQMHKLKLLVAAVAAAFAILGVAGPAAADEPPMFYKIATDDAWAAGMALAQANVATARGHKVTVFLNVRGVHLANENASSGTFGAIDKTPADLLRSLIEKGQQVLVCGNCMRVGGVSEDDLIEGAVVSNPDLMFGALTAPGTIVLSY
jgi:predicted peroxiredoxin